MATNTSNYNLIKPGQDDFYDIDDFNQNADVIDAQLKNVNDKADNAQNTASYAATTAEDVQDTLNTHLSDYVRQPGYGVTAGSANTYTLTLSPAPAAYTDGMGIVVKINAANTGAATINVNGLGAKAIVDGKGNALTSGKLRLSGTYSLKYNTTSGNFILQGSDSSGNATPADLLAGKTASTDTGDIIGTMVNRGAVTINPSNTDQAIAVGYHNGSGKVSAVTGTAIAADVANGKTFSSAAGINLVGTNTGKKWQFGTIVAAVSQPFVLSGLSFKPSKVFLEYRELYQPGIGIISSTADLSGNATYYIAANGSASGQTNIMTNDGFNMPSNGFFNLNTGNWYYRAYE